jgi:hypothetical protein
LNDENDSEANSSGNDDTSLNTSACDGGDLSEDYDDNFAAGVNTDLNDDLDLSSLSIDPRVGLVIES